MAHQLLAATQSELKLLIGLRLAADNVVTEAIANRQWLTAHTIAQHEPPLEVEAPDLVCASRLRQVLSQHTMHTSLTFALLRQAMTIEDVVDRVDVGPIFQSMNLQQQIMDLLRSPCRMLAPFF